MKHEVKALPKEEVLANRAKAYGFIDFDNCKDCNKSLKDCTCINDTLDMKQETLEEVAENESEYLADYEDKEAYQKAFIAGAKWQQERSYSEEEVVQLLDALWNELDIWYNKEDDEQFNLIRWFSDSGLYKERKI